jgi:DNA-binding transcriptional ArsR family regulator
LTSIEDGKALQRIERALADIRAILVLTNHDTLEKIKKELLPQGSVKERIYELCDGSNTTKMIAQELGKDEAYVRANLSVLRREGLVRTVEKDRNQVHEQVF